jgi:hypothetical protein
VSDLAADLAALLGADPSTLNQAEIRTIVRNRGDMRNTNRFPDAVIDIEIQAAFGEGYELIADTNEGYFDTSDQVITTTGVAFVGLPTGTWRVRAIDRLDGSDYVEMRQTVLGERNRFGSQNGMPRAYILTARGIDLYPTPDAAYTLRVIYTPVAPALDETSLQFYNGWQEYAVYGALVRLYQQKNRDASEWERGLEKQRARLLRAASQRKAQEPEYLNLREGMGGEFGDPHPWWSW